eukprot:898875-Pelagomonas_calceolata.AAC.2
MMNGLKHVCCNRSRSCMKFSRQRFKLRSNACARSLHLSRLLWCSAFRCSLHTGEQHSHEKFKSCLRCRLVVSPAMLCQKSRSSCPARNQAKQVCRIEVNDIHGTPA